MAAVSSKRAMGEVWTFSGITNSLLPQSQNYFPWICCLVICYQLFGTLIVLNFFCFREFLIAELNYILAVALHHYT